MALPPTVPTSFVPRQPVATVRPRGGLNYLLVGSLILLALSVIAAIGTFVYDQYLGSAMKSKQAALTTAQAGIDQGTLDDLVRLHDRLASSATLLDQHVITSQFLDALEAITLANVRFSSLKLAVLDDRSAHVEMAGTARSFNALAAESQAFAAEKRIRRAIFSSITVNKDNSVSFVLTADLDPSVLIESKAAVAAPPAAPAVPSARTPAATSTQPATTRPASASTTAATTTSP